MYNISYIQALSPQLLTTTGTFWGSLRNCVEGYGMGIIEFRMFLDRQVSYLSFSDIRAFVNAKGRTRYTTASVTAESEILNLIRPFWDPREP